MSKFNKEEFYVFINPVALAVGIIGLCLWLEVNYEQIAMTGGLIWSVTGILHIEAQKKKTINKKGLFRPFIIDFKSRCL